jgi:hypothetical protein
LSVLATCTAALGNVGVFAGSGHTIKLVHSADVQMVSEEVTIVPGRGRFLFDGTVPGMNRVEYRCKFTLKNRSAKPVAIQAGFPLDSQFFRSPNTTKKADEADIVLQYKFIARDQDKTYHVRFVPCDAAKHLAAIFLWDMDFQAGETRELRVAYEMPISMSLASGAKEEHGQKYAKHWYGNLEAGLVESFGYVTETGRSWAGPVEKAEIHVYLGGFEKYLSARRVVENPEASEEHPDGKGSRQGFLDSYCKDWLMHRQIEPKGWTEKDGTVTWQFKGSVPEGPVAVSYLLVGVPQSVDGLRALVQSTLVAKPAAPGPKADNPFADAEAKEAVEISASKLADNLADLREILLASWGIAPHREPVRAFAANQVWYAPKSGATEQGLTPQQKRVLSELDRLSAKPH